MNEVELVADTLGSLVAFPTDWLGIFTGIAFAACVGDAWAVLKLKRFPDDMLIQDNPTDIDCDVFSLLA